MPTAYVPTSAYSPKLNTVITKPDFFTTLALYGKRIIESVSVTNNTVHVYDVPVGKTFFLISAQLSVAIPSTAAVLRTATLGTTPTAAAFLSVTVDNVNTTAGTGDGGQICSQSSSLSFPVPIRFVSTEYIMLRSGSSLAVSTGSIVGIEIETALLPFN